MKVKQCPRCGKKGSLNARWVLNGSKKRFEPYWYVGHYEDGKTVWCYVPREVAADLIKSLSNKVQGESQ